MSFDPMNRTILIVDDNPAEREIFSTYLEFVGGRLLQAHDGAEGLKVAREHQPELILLDLTMPVMDGWEMIRHVQVDPALAGIPVLALTSHHLPPERLEEAGFCGYLEKPIAPFRVLQEVERCLGPLYGLEDASGGDDVAAEGVRARNTAMH
jgi:two-component system, cell cycle response regulator DivK